MKVLASNRGTATDLPLSLWRCEALANRYLGFNGWSSAVLYHRKEGQEELAAQAGAGLRVRVKFCSAVRLTFRARPELQVEGAGKETGEMTHLSGYSKSSLVLKNGKISGQKYKKTLIEAYLTCSPC